jgi:DNA-damage-inducible protein D
MKEDNLPEPQETKLSIFQGKKIRRVFQKDEWCFSIVDIVEVLTESTSPSRYWTELKNKMIKVEDVNQLFDKIERFKMKASDGKMRETDVANTETMFRIIQSIPSPKAEPFKRWLARVGYERTLEDQNPELTVQRAIGQYKGKGYSDKWIATRLRGIQTRDKLTDEWKNRGIKQPHQYAMLTAKISKETFGLTPADHKELKGLKKENLRDNMTPLELIFNELAEASTKELIDETNPQGFKENEQAAKEGGAIAGDARKALEKKTGKKVITSQRPLDDNLLS